MPVQWTVHIPQAMQRHGGSIEPEVETECDEAMSRFFRTLRQPEAAPSPSVERADARPAH